MACDSFLRSDVFGWLLRPTEFGRGVREYVSSVPLLTKCSSSWLCVTELARQVVGAVLVLAWPVQVRWALVVSTLEVAPMDGFN